MCDKVSKRILMSLNGLTASAGIAGIVGGVVMKVKTFAIFQSVPVDMMRMMGSENATDAVETVSDFVRTAPYFVIALGSFILIISICGSVGAKWGKIWLLRVYKLILLLLLAAFGILTFLIFTKQDTIQGMTDTFLETLFTTYTNHKPSSELMDVIQVQFKCCGVNSSADWNEAQAWQSMAKERAESEETYLGTEPVPDSCCMEPKNKPSCGLAQPDTMNFTKIYVDGCSEMVWQTLKENELSIGIGAIALATLMLFCIVLSCSIISFVHQPPQQHYKK